MRNFSQAEREILQHFAIGQYVEFKHCRYEIKKVGKPICTTGEPKTDIYLLLKSNKDEIEIKISYKKENADFLENKISAERAEQLFGTNWKSVIENSTSRIHEKFLERPLIYKSRYKRTDKGAITLGWKFELVNKISGELSGEILLTEEQYIDVYSGSNLSSNKRNAIVNGEIITNSGVANCILFGNQFSSAQAILDSIESIKDYIKHRPKIYFACKALNYRTFQKKFDGNRPLAVQVSWNVLNNKLTPELVFNQPLSWNGKDVKIQLHKSLAQLNIETTEDVNQQNAEISCVYP